MVQEEHEVWSLDPFACVHFEAWYPLFGWFGRETKGTSTF